MTEQKTITTKPYQINKGESMEDLNKRLVEVEYILKKLDDKYIKKIPQEIWDYIDINKDKNYVFNYYDNKSLAEQKLNIDTISILTYINMKYLISEEQKKEMKEILKKDEAIAEQEKSRLYKLDDLFKNRTANKQQDTSLIEIKTEKWYQRILSFFKNIFNK